MGVRGCSGIDKMSCEQMLPWLLANKDALIRSLLDGSYRPNPVKRVEIPKDNGKMRLLGIPTVVDRLVQQAINQTLTPIYERQCFLHSFLHKVRFNYYRLIYRFCPSWNVIEYSTTMASADFSRQTSDPTHRNLI